MLNFIATSSFLAGFILLIGIANDTATIPQIIIVSLIAILLMGIGLVCAHIVYAKSIAWYYIDFVDAYGHHRRVRAFTKAGYHKAVSDYRNLGYELYADGVVYKEDLA